MQNHYQCALHIRNSLKARNAGRRSWCKAAEVRPTGDGNFSSSAFLVESNGTFPRQNAKWRQLRTSAAAVKHPHPCVYESATPEEREAGRGTGRSKQSPSSSPKADAFSGCTLEQADRQNLALNRLAETAPRIVSGSLQSTARTSVSHNEGGH